MGLFNKSKNHTKQNNNGLIESYKVVYKGGLPDYPKPKVSALVFQMFTDRFEIHPTNAAKWFSDLIIPFEQVNSLKIAERQVGTAEGILGGLNSRQLNQANNIHINFIYKDQDLLLRLEMLTGVTVMGQAKKCKELEDRLSTNGIRQKFSTDQSGQPDDIANKLSKLGKLREKGLLTDEEFKSAKNLLLD